MHYVNDADLLCKVKYFFTEVYMHEMQDFYQTLRKAEINKLLKSKSRIPPLISIIVSIYSTV